MNNLGIYAVEENENLQLTGYTDPGNTWKRTSLVFNGREFRKTANEKNNFGLYKLDNMLYYNGEVIAVGEKDLSLSATSDDLKINNNILCSNKHCINITKDNYNNLRKGKDVNGYGRYSEWLVYNITDSNVPVEFESDEGLEDVVYNSLSGELPENTLTEKTFTSHDTPTLAMRYFDPVLKKGQGVNIEYFVDTKDSDSIYKKVIGDTFTTIVEDSYGNVIFKKTTYAGQFKGTTLPFKDALGNDIIGRTWFSIRCIDNKGCGSLEWFFDVLIKEDRQESYYKMTEADLATYRITPNGNWNDLTSGYYNRKGFEKLFNDKKKAGYDGVILYNPRKDTTSFDSPSNFCYYIDNHLNLKTYPEVEINTDVRYYLVKYNADSGKIENINKEYKDYVIADFEKFLIKKGRTFDVDGVQRTVNKDNPYDWIRKDGAYIYRNEDNKIIVAWNFAHDEDEANLTSSSSSLRILRIRSLNRLLAKAKTGTIETYFPEGSGYYYMMYTTLKYSNVSSLGINVYGEPGISLPDNFTVDMNYTTWKHTNNCDLHTKVKMLWFRNTFNCHFKNGKLVGNHTLDNLKDAFLRLCKLGASGTWEGASLVGFVGSKFCSMENIELCNSCGYECTFGPLGLSQTGDGVGSAETSSSFDATKPSTYPSLFFNTLGYIGLDGKLKTTNIVIKDSQGKSILPTTAADYSPNSTDICLVTTYDYVSCKNPKYTFEKVDGSREERTCQDLYLGSTPSWGTKGFHGGKLLERFITFFDANNKMIKSVKTMQHNNVKIPRNATKFKLTLHGLCSVVNGQPILYKDSKGRPVGLNEVYILPKELDQGGKFIDCYFHDTRTTAAGGPCINTIYKHCTFEKIAGLVPKRFVITPLLSDIEESCCLMNLFAMHDCTVIEIPSPNTNFWSNSQTIVGALLMRNLDIRNCVGVGYNGPTDKGYIADSRMSILSLGFWGGLGNNFRNIIKRTNVCYLLAFRYGQDKHLDVNGMARNSCDDEVTKVSNLEDCFLNAKAYNTYREPQSLSGRVYKFGNDLTTVYKD